MSSEHFHSPAARLVARFDRDHYWAALFAPAAARARFIAISAYAVEVALVRERVSQPTLGLMRLQWWRETLARLRTGRVPNEPVAQALAAAYPPGTAPDGALEALIAAREEEIVAGPPRDLEDLVARVAASAGVAACLRLEALGQGGGAMADAARAVGTAYGLAGTLRAAAFHAAAGRQTLPLNEAPGGAWDEPGRARLAALAERVAACARDELNAARGACPRPDRRVLAAFLPAALAAADIARIGRRRHDLSAPNLSGSHPGRLLRLALAASRGRY